MRRRRYSMIVSAVLLLVAAPVAVNLVSNVVPMTRLRWLWAVVALVIVVAVLHQVRAESAAGGKDAGIDLDRVADELAATVASALREEEEHRRITEPVALPVSWRAVSDDRADLAANISRTPVGMEPAVLQVAGRIEQIAAVYGRIPSGRLVVLGEVGSGKTVLATRLARDLLAQRQPGQPVPVVVNIASWNPAVPLRRWLAQQISRDFPRTAVSYSVQQNLADALAESDRLLPILDGLDEIGPGLQPEALRQLSGASDSPLVVTCRPTEYTQAMRDSMILSSAAVVELEALSFSDVLDYLTRTTRRRSNDGGVWEPVKADVSEPGSASADVLREALRSPLMVFLARSIYSDGGEADAAQLLGFTTARDVQRHLVAGYVPARFRQGQARRAWRPQQVQQWLGYMALDLERRGGREVAWWQIADSIPPFARVLIACIPMAVASLVFGGLTVHNIGIGASFAVLACPLYGLFFLAPSPSPAQIRWRWRQPLRIVGIYVKRGSRFGLVGGVLLLGFAIFGYPYPASAPSSWRAVFYIATFAVGLALGVVLGVCAGLFVAIFSGLEARIDVARSVNPAQSRAADRTRTLYRVVLVALLLLVYCTAAAGWWGPVYSLIFSALLVLPASSWLRWLLFVRCWLPLRRRLPWRVPALLEEAHQRGVLRQSGAVYLFVHALLQEHLADTAWEARKIPFAP